ncbi:Glycoside hydrolase, catalytic domain [Phytophthora cactorum]|nr:Glycoside hydrolase, catalytic domain [Phytophthora cactorum]
MHSASNEDKGHSRRSTMFEAPGLQIDLRIARRSKLNLFAEAALGTSWIAWYINISELLHVQYNPPSRPSADLVRYQQISSCITYTTCMAILANSLSQVKAYRISITTTPILESWEGWGTSLSWWADVFGDCEDIVDVLFSNLSSVSIDGAAKDIPALNFNIARYNIGGSGNNVIDDSGRRLQ